MSLPRNLIMHVYPRTCGKWRRSVAHLLAPARWSQFDGRKIVSIAVDGCCDSPQNVIDSFSCAPGVQFVIRENVSGLQETASFGPLLGHVLDSPGITLYCHAKGCTHADDSAPSHAWCDAMAAACLDYPRLVECVFESGKNLCGGFRVHSGWGFSGYHDWHFAGTWYWFRNSRVRELNLSDCRPVFYGTEAWPGAFRKEEGACLFFDGTNSHDLYQRNFWRESVNPSLAVWRANLARAGLTPLVSPDFRP